MNIPTQFKAFFSKDALELAIWAYEEKDREKQIRIARIADKIEIKSRQLYGGLNGIRRGQHMIEYPSMLLPKIMRSPPPPPKPPPCRIS